MIFHTFLSPLGPLVLIANNGKLLYCNWDSPDCQAKLDKIKSQISSHDSPDDLEIIKETVSQLKEYFDGSRKNFFLPLHYTATPFCSQVWHALMTVPYGKTLSYKELSLIAGFPKGYRAVAGACGANPIAIILPCHRIIASDGSPGGYTGGLDKKIRLLDLEKKNCFQI